jgi:hypothetical protein
MNNTRDEIHKLELLYGIEVALDVVSVELTEIIYNELLREYSGIKYRIYAITTTELREYGNT